MRLSPAAVSFQCSPISRSAGAVRRRRGRAPGVAAGAARTDRSHLEVTIPAPDLNFITRSIVGGKPFNPQRGLGHRLEDIARALGAWWECRRRNRIGGEAPLGGGERQPVHNPERRKEPNHVATFGKSGTGLHRGSHAGTPARPPAGRGSHAGTPARPPAGRGSHAGRPARPPAGEDPTQGGQHGHQP